ncbi:MAG: PAS domain-containing protein, partial [Magnetococcales bacterium]|nr:PAS domain-containing protein [Magnetococcales bacterium]
MKRYDDGNILIVDDTPEAKHFLAEALKEQGYTVRVRAIRSADGQIDLYFSTVHEQRLRQIKAALTEALYMVDMEGCITFINAFALTLLGWNEEQVLGQLAHSLFHHTRIDGSCYPYSASLVYEGLHQDQ